MSLCERCQERPSTQAYFQAGSLVLRRLAYCAACMAALVAEKRQTLPRALWGTWPIDFDEVRRQLPSWLQTASAEERREAAHYIGLVAGHYGQQVPGDVIGSLKAVAE